jgi:beta-galactosidase GanA
MDGKILRWQLSNSFYLTPKLTFPCRKRSEGIAKTKKESHRFRWLKEIYGGTEQQLHRILTLLFD